MNMQIREWGIEKSIKRLLWCGCIASTFFQLLLFPTVGVFALCMMSLFVCFVYCHFFLKRDLFLRYPFASIVFISIFLYRYLPPIATLIDGNPVTIGIMSPIRLAVLETFAFLSFSLAFYCSIRFQKKNKLRDFWTRIGLFKPQSSVVYWIIGCVGVGCAYFRMMTMDNVEMGDAGGKFLNGLTYLRFVPLVMMFPSLFGLDSTKMPSKLSLYLWTFFMVIVGVGSNGRKNMIIPVVVVALMLLLVWFIKGDYFSKIFSPVKAGFLLVLGITFISVFSDLSLAMLNTRSIRSDVRGVDLLSSTLEVYSDDAKMEHLWREKERKEAMIVGYNEEWTETYVSSHFLNRYCNIRVSDECLYYAERVDKRLMMGNFSQMIMFVLPTPVINSFFGGLDKSNLLYSRGDFLYATATMTPILAGYRVVSHVGDGMATFGYFCYVIFFLVYFVDFYLINSLSCSEPGVPILSVVGGAYVADFLNFYCNANGILKDINFAMRGYWQLILLYLLIVFIVSHIVRIFGVRS